jgi:hypothetical protein
VGTDTDWIVNNFHWMMDNVPDFNVSLYGDGTAAQQIANQLTKKTIRPLT